MRDAARWQARHVAHHPRVGNLDPPQLLFDRLGQCRVGVSERQRGVVALEHGHRPTRVDDAPGLLEHPQRVIEMTDEGVQRDKLEVTVGVLKSMGRRQSWGKPEVIATVAGPESCIAAPSPIKQ